VKLTLNLHCTDTAQEVDPNIDAVFTDDSGEYIVERTDLSNQKSAFEFKLAVKRRDKQPIRTWRVLQDIKNQIAGDDRYAIEVYPPESEVTDTGNIYHLWVFPKGAGPTVKLTS
jgi:hypothetical protein